MVERTTLTSQCLSKGMDPDEDLILHALLLYYACTFWSENPSRMGLVNYQMAISLGKLSMNHLEQLFDRRSVTVHAVQGLDYDKHIPLPTENGLVARDDALQCFFECAQ